MDRRTVVAGLIAGLVISCSSPASELAGDMLQDAGDAMAGAGGEMSAAGMRGIGDLLGGVGGVMAGVGGMLAGEGGSGAGGSPSGGMSGAMAQPSEPTSIDGSCSVESGLTTEWMVVEQTQKQVTYYAEFDIGDRSVEDLVGASVILCEWQTIGVENLCSEGTTCTKIGTYPRHGDCQVTSGIEIKGSVAAVPCGTLWRLTTTDGTAESGGKWTSVRLVIP